MEPVMTIGSSAVTEAPVEERRSVLGRGGGPLSRAVARAPISVRAKLLVGFGLIVVLLVVSAVAGLLALRQSSSRAEQLRTEERRASLVLAVLADARSAQAFVSRRVLLTPSRKGETGEPNSFYTSLDSTIGSLFGALGSDASAGQETGTAAARPTYLQRWYPGLSKGMDEEGVAVSLTLQQLSSRDRAGRGASASRLANRLQSEADWFVNALRPKSRQAQRRTNELVAEDRSSYRRSRNLLLGISTGSVALALALALLISSSLLTPLRRTGARMAEIAAGDFTGHLEVPNRDEIGTLATNVNQMNDELGRLYQELETASRHKSDFLATTSHELRTPLNAIIGFSEVLQQQMFGELNERQLGYVDDVLEAGRHLLSLINDILDLAKIEAGRMDLELSEVAIADLLRSAVSMHSERADRGGIELVLATEPTEISVTADDRRIRQIVFNLLSNAVKFTPPGGRIDVSARLDNGLVEIEVADTGPGVAAADLESIFEEFEQAGDGRQAEGTGLGLPLSRKLAELHGGHLWAESRLGLGSTFHLTVPVTQEAS